MPQCSGCTVSSKCMESPSNGSPPCSNRSLSNRDNQPMSQSLLPHDCGIKPKTTMPSMWPLTCPYPNPTLTIRPIRDGGSIGPVPPRPKPKTGNGPQRQMPLTLHKPVPIRGRMEWSKPPQPLASITAQSELSLCSAFSRSSGMLPSEAFGTEWVIIWPTLIKPNSTFKLTLKLSFQSI